MTRQLVSERSRRAYIFKAFFLIIYFHIDWNSAQMIMIHLWWHLFNCFYPRTCIKGRIFTYMYIPVSSILAFQQDMINAIIRKRLDSTIDRAYSAAQLQISKEPWKIKIHTTHSILSHSQIVNMQWSSGLKFVSAHLTLHGIITYTRPQDPSCFLILFHQS